jgi:putative membrane protein
LNTLEPGKWRRTSPLSVLFFIGRTIRLLIKNTWQSLAPLLLLVVTVQGDLFGKLQIAGIVLGALIVAESILSYWFFRFHISDKSILIRQGWLKKKQLDIKFDRIQGINTQQNLIYRLLGLLNVSFDTAGSGGNEGNLPAVTREFADSLLERIGKERLTVEADKAESEAQSGVLVSLDWRDMIRIGLANRRALIVIALIGPLFEKLGDEFDTYVERTVLLAASNGIEVTTTNGLVIGLTIFLGLALILAGFSVTAAFLRYHNFVLWLDGQTLRSRGGLITRHENSMDLGKIQTLRLQQGIVERWQRRFCMTARQAVASGKDRSKKVFSIPSVPILKADQLRKLFLAPEAGDLSQDPRFGGFKKISPLYMRSKILFIGLVPSLLATIALSQLAGAVALVFLLWLPLVAAVTYRNWQRAGFMHDDQEIFRRSGIMGYRTVGLLFRKVQRVTLTQSRYQRRKNLASLRMNMASGSVRVPYIDHDTAKQLRDYILYKVESSQQAWH